MSNFVPTKRNLQEDLLFCFHLKKSVAKSQRMVSEAYDYTRCQYINTFDAMKKMILTRNIQIDQKSLKMKK